MWPGLSCRAAVTSSPTRPGLSGNWIGLILLGTVTSLPELVTGISSVTAAQVPNVAVGDVLGSYVFNLLILVALDFLHRESPVNLFDILILAVDDLFYLKGPILSHVSPAHAFSAGSAVVMTGLVIVSLLYRPGKQLFRTAGWTSLGLFVLYLLNTYVIYLHGN